IGCEFSSAVKNSPQGPKAEWLNFSLLIGVFHGHTHNHLCQLKYLATYSAYLEGCKQFFSKSNALVRSIQYTGVFYCQQAITTYVAYHDTFGTHANLSESWLCLVGIWQSSTTFVNISQPDADAS
ncbi:hypothetical protein B0H10DRAFT_1783127, partial [Mycena sp. CBHHK59/15]